MPSRFFLNNLDEQNSQIPVPTPGEWASDSESRDFLVRYASSIKLGQLADPTVSHSVPSAFARPIQFFQALSSSEHPLHDAVVSEWRGLLGIFALQDMFGLTVVQRVYAVPSAEDLIKAAKNPGKDLNVTTILRNQLPYPAEDWNRWWLLYCNNQLIGATSPWTIAYTAAQYRCPERVPWQTNKRLLKDPTQYLVEVGGEYELTILRRWVELVLDGGVWGMTGHLENKASAIRRELEAWKEELDKYQSAVTVSSLVDQALVDQSPYQYFFRKPLIDKGQAAPASDLLLAGRKGIGDTLVLTRDGLDPKMRVWGAVFADQIDLKRLPGPKGDAGWATRNGVSVACPYLIAEEFFLAPVLLEIGCSPNALDRGADHYALPLTPAFFKFISYQTLIQQEDMLSISATDDNVVVRLYLPLKNAGVLKVEKIYDKKTDVIQFRGPTPALAIWPDFTAGDWEQNYAVYAGTDETKIGVAPLLRDGRELAKVEALPGQQVYIWPDKEPLIGFVIYVNHKLPGAKQVKRHSAGLVLRAGMRRPVDPNPALQWTVAVDFGTSSTTMFLDRGDGRPVLLSIRGRMQLLTTAEASMKEQVLAGLYPETPLTPPFVTLLAMRTASIVSGTPPTSVWDPRFLFYPESKEHLLSNVKWGKGGGADDLPLLQYLRSVTQLIASEARDAGVGKLEFRWSYPMALPEGARGAMGNFWDGVADRLSRPGGMVVTSMPGITESDAVCRCLAAIKPAILNQLAGGLSVAVDVGGGSTDIGFWSGAVLLDQVSLKLAGNDLLPRFWSINEFVSRLYKVCTGAPWEETYGTKFNDHPALMLNVALSRASAEGDPRRHPFLEDLGQLPIGDRPWVEIRSLIYLFFCGVAFYIGLHARKTKVETNVVQVYFGGRGASLLAWVGTAAKTREMLESALRQGFSRDMQQNEKAKVEVKGAAIEFRRDLAPKEEVVRGLLAEPIWKSREGQAAPDGLTVIPGETGWCDRNGNAVAWDKPLHATELAALSPPPNHESSYIAHFMTVIKEHIAELNLDPALQHLWDGSAMFSVKVQHQLAKAGNPGETVLEPVFAAELQTIMDQYIEIVLRQNVNTAQLGG